MNVEQAMRIVIKPYVTEKTFAMVENESKVCFIVERSANKPQIVEAIKILYNENATNVNTARTVYGKKAFVIVDNLTNIMHHNSYEDTFRFVHAFTNTLRLAGIGGNIVIAGMNPEDSSKYEILSGFADAS